MTTVTIYRIDNYDNRNVAYSLQPRPELRYPVECDNGKEYILPDEFSVGAGGSGELYIYDSKNKHCPLIHYGNHPAIVADSPHPIPLVRVDNIEGNKLKHYRLLRGYTQQSLASATGIHVNQITKYESGEYALSGMRLKTAAALARTLGIDTTDLLDD